MVETEAFPLFGAVLVLCGFVIAHIIFKLRTLDSDIGTHFSTIDPTYFDKRLIWITGASSGIGRGMALKIASVAQRCTFVLSARNEEKLMETEMQIKKLNPECDVFVLPMDLNKSDVEYFKDKHQMILDAYPESDGVDILVHNGGFSMRCTAMDLSVENHLNMQRVLMTSPILLTLICLPKMKEKGFGHIVVISSLAGKLFTAIRTMYGATKAGVAAYHEGLRNEVRPFGISVTNIFPGYVKTNVDINALDKDGQKMGQPSPAIQNGMKMNRFASLALCAISGKVNSSIIAKNELMILYYAATYLEGPIANYMRYWASNRNLKELGYSVKPLDLIGDLRWFTGY